MSWPLSVFATGKKHSCQTPLPSSCSGYAHLLVSLLNQRWGEQQWQPLPLPSLEKGENKLGNKQAWAVLAASQVMPY